MSELIDRRVVIYALDRTKENAIENLDGRFQRTVLKMLNVLISIVNSLPAYNSNPNWISCKEQLPKAQGEVLLTYHDEVTIGWLYEDGTWAIYEGESNAQADEVVAWMPLPEPYKGVTE